MRTPLLAAVSVVFVACSAPITTRPPPRSWTEHMRVAAAEEERAAEHDRAAGLHAELSEKPNKVYPVESYQCGDTVLYDQMTSGTERITGRLPCWNPHEEDAVRERALADLHREQARDERTAALDLIRAEQLACQGIPERERDHSVFAHRSAIIEVIPHYEGTAIRGAHVVFAHVAGLSEDWIRQDIACQQARFQTLGWPERMRDDPSLVDGATVSVDTQRGRFIVLIETADDEAGAEVLARARALIGSRTATR